MNELHVKAIIAGVFFGLWPLLMNRSGLSGNVSAAAFSVGVLAIVFPFALYEIRNVNVNVGWMMVCGACIAGGLGLLTFNSMLSKATLQTVGSLFILMTVVQITIPAIYHMINGGQITTAKIIGFAAAGLAAFMLIE